MEIHKWVTSELDENVIDLLLIGRETRYSMWEDWKTDRPFFFVKLPYSATEPPWHSNCLDCIQTYGQGHRAGHVNVSPHLAFRHHCEILVWIRAGYLELLRETGGVYDQRGLSQQLILQYKMLRWQRLRVDMLLQHWASKPPSLSFSLQFTVTAFLFSQPWELRTALESKWNEPSRYLWAMLCWVLNMVVLSGVETGSILACLCQLI